MVNFGLCGLLYDAVTGNIPRACDPTKYREPSFYHQLLQRVSIATDDADGQYVFEVIMCKPLQTYIKVSKVT